MAALKDRISAATTAAMKARDKARVAALRLINAEIKRLEVDERRDLDDGDVLNVLGRMLKQRQDSLAQYEAAGRSDLAAQETFEIELIREFMPEPLSADALAAEVQAVIDELGASSMKDMGAVMASLKARVGGRADMGQVSAAVKARLAG